MFPVPADVVEWRGVAMPWEMMGRIWETLGQRANQMEISWLFGCFEVEIFV